MTGNVEASFVSQHIISQAVNPVSMGKTRARQQTIKDGAYAKDQKKDWSDDVLNIQVSSHNPAFRLTNQR